MVDQQELELGPAMEHHLPQQSYRWFRHVSALAAKCFK